MSSKLLLALVCVLAVAYGATVEMESSMDLQAAAELAILAAETPAATPAEKAADAAKAKEEKEQAAKKAAEEKAAALAGTTTSTPAPAAPQQDNKAWFIKAFDSAALQAANAQEAIGPFTHIGLTPVTHDGKPIPAAPAVPTPAQVIDSIIRTGNPNPPAAPRGPLVKAKILEEEPANPLLPVNYSAPIKPISREALRKLKPAVILGIPSKHDRAAYKAYKKSQETFGYLGLKPINTTGVKQLPNSTTGNGRSKNVTYTRVKVIDSTVEDTLVAPVNATELEKLKHIPAIVPGLQPSPEWVNPTEVAPTLASTLPFYSMSAPNKPEPVPGATEGPTFPAQTSFLEMEAAAEAEAEAELEMEAAEPWSILNGGLANLIEESVAHHEANVEKINSMAAELAETLAAEDDVPNAMLLSVAETVSAEQGVDAEVAEHHELAAAHQIPAQFAFVRSARALGKSIDSLSEEQLAHEELLADKVSFLEEAIEAAQSADLEAESEADAEAEVDSEAEAEEELEAEGEMESEAESEADSEAESEADAESESEEKSAGHSAGAHSGSSSSSFTVGPGTTAADLRAHLAALGHVARIPTRYHAPRFWRHMSAYPYSVVPHRAVVSVRGPHPAVVRALAGRLANIRRKLHLYRNDSGRSVRLLAGKVERLLNKLARASIVERRIVARALATRAGDLEYRDEHRRRVRRSIKKAEREAKAATTEADAAKKDLKEEISKLADANEVKKAAEAEKAKETKESKEESKDDEDTKEDSKDAKKESKEEAKEVAKEEAKEAVKEAAKEESKEAAKEEAKDDKTEKAKLETMKEVAAATPAAAVPAAPSQTATKAADKAADALEKAKDAAAAPATAETAEKAIETAKAGADAAKKAVEKVKEDAAAVEAAVKKSIANPNDTKAAEEAKAAIAKEKEDKKVAAEAIENAKKTEAVLAKVVAKVPEDAAPAVKAEAKAAIADAKATVSAAQTKIDKIKAAFLEGAPAANADAAKKTDVATAKPTPEVTATKTEKAVSTSEKIPEPPKLSKEDEAKLKAESEKKNGKSTVAVKTAPKAANPDAKEQAKKKAEEEKKVAEEKIEKEKKEILAKDATEYTAVLAKVAALEKLVAELKSQNTKAVDDVTKAQKLEELKVEALKQVREEVAKKEALEKEAKEKAAKAAEEQVEAEKKAKAEKEAAELKAKEEAAAAAKAKADALREAIEKKKAELQHRKDEILKEQEAKAKAEAEKRAAFDQKVTDLAKAEIAKEAAQEKEKETKTTDNLNKIKSDKASDPEAITKACHNAQAYHNKCTSLKLREPMCFRAVKALSSAACQAVLKDNADKKATFIESEVEAESQSQATAELVEAADADEAALQDADNELSFAESEEVDVDDAEALNEDISKMAAHALAEDAQEEKEPSAFDMLPVEPTYRSGQTPAYRVQGAARTAPVNNVETDVFSQIARALDRS